MMDTRRETWGSRLDVGQIINVRG